MESWYYNNNNNNAFYILMDVQMDVQMDIRTDPNSIVIKNCDENFSTAISGYQVIAISHISGIRKNMYPAHPYL